MLLTISNHGPLITATNYWRTDAATAGNLYLSINAGAFRLLVPPLMETIIPDLATGREAIISRGPWPAKRQAAYIEILLDDGTPNPWSCHLDTRSIDRLPLDEDAAKEWVFTVWTRPRRLGDRPHKALERVARYRRVDVLPWLKPWEGK